MKLMKIVSIVSVAGISLMASTALYAQNSIADEEIKPAKSNPNTRNQLLEEIIVTSQKREENLSDVPISISAFSGDTLDIRGITDPKELQLATPGLTYSELVSYAIIYLRGVGSDAFVPTADTSVATYIDGVYFPFLHGLAQSFGSIKRVEVLKGPQGTLFGRNSTGGAINIITESPSQDFFAKAELGYETFESLKSKFFVAGPLTDTLSASFSGLYNNAQEYHYEPGEASIIREYPGPETLGFNGKLNWKPLDWVESELSLYDISSDTTGSAILTMRETSALGSLLGIPTTDEDYVANTNRRDFVDVDFFVGTLTNTFDFEHLTIKTISAYQDLLTNAQQDFDGSEVDIVSFSPPGQFAKVHTEEIQFISPGDSALDWIGGLYYIESHAGYRPLEFRLVGTDNLLGVLPIDIGNLLQPLGLDLLNPITNLGLRAQVNGSVETLSYSAFAQASYDFNDWLTLTLGGRYQYEERSIDDASTQVVAPDSANGNIITLLTHPKDEFEVNNFSPKIAINFNIFEDSMLYVSYAKGFKSGTFNPINLIDAPDQVDPEIVETVELGIKGSWLEGSLRGSAAVFQNKIQDVQVLIFSLLSGGVVSLENAAEAEINGAEFDLTWAPFGSLALFISTSYLDGEYTSYPDASGFDEAGLFRSNAYDFSGNKSVRTPKITTDVGFNYNYQQDAGEFEVGADIYYNDGFFYDGANVLTEDPYYLVSAHASYYHYDSHLKLTLFGKNLADEIYTYAKYQNDFGKLESLAPPRVIGAKVSWEF